MWLVGGTIPESDAARRLYNTCTVYAPSGQLIARYRKVRRLPWGGGSGLMRSAP